MEDEERIGGPFFPQPPPFYKHFTSDNVEALKKFKEAHSDGNDESAALSPTQLLSLPPELRCLVPPEPPGDDEQYRVFGQTTSLNQPSETLEDWGYERIKLSPTTSEDGTDESKWTVDRAHFLQRIIRSVLLSFLELLGIMSINPAGMDWKEKMTDIATLVANAHTLINEYRPHQARETLILMMEDQLERKKAEVEGVKRMKGKIEEALASFRASSPELPDEIGVDRAQKSTELEKRKEMQRHMWQTIEEVLGH
jgi:mediator of RNA polymerase II transcription subunit 7